MHRAIRPIDKAKASLKRLAYGSDALRLIIAQCGSHNDWRAQGETIVHLGCLGLTKKFEICLLFSLSRLGWYNYLFSHNTCLT